MLRSWLGILVYLAYFAAFTLHELVSMYPEKRDFPDHTARGVTEARCRLAWIVSPPPSFPVIASRQIL